MTTTLPCPRCRGTGEIDDPRVTGSSMRCLRQRANLTLHEVARRCCLSVSYISDLERGQRQWSATMKERFVAALHASV